MYRMELLTAALRRQLPGLEQADDDPMVWCVLFMPDGPWRWYVTEFDGDDLCFGLVDGGWPELGYFRLSEVQALRGALGLAVERDTVFVPQRLSFVRRP